MSLTQYLRAQKLWPQRAAPVLDLHEAFEETAAQIAQEAGQRTGNPMADFFAMVREITGPLDQTQVDSINAILDRMQGEPRQHIAYVLATAWHEARFKPQKEWGRGRGKPYGKPGRYAQPQYGRGLVQLTWDYNYEWADKRLGLNGALLKNFDMALEPRIAADILVKGMQEGAFASNGHGLSAYGPDEGGKFDYLHARQTVNRMDKAQLIAGYAERFERALEAL